MLVSLEYHQLPGVTVVGVHGELDLQTTALIEESLQRLWRPGDELIVNLAKTTFIDCSGLRALIRAHHHVRQGGGLVRLAALQPAPAKIIQLAELDTVLSVHPSLRHAIRAAFNDPLTRSPGP